MQDNSEWQIDIQSVIKKLITGKNIILITILTLFGLVVGLIAYPSVAKNINYEVKVEILPTTELQNPMSGYMTTDDMLREFGMSIRSIKNEYVGEINDYGFEKKYSRIIYSTSITDFDKKIYLEAQSSNKEDLEVYAVQILKLSGNILKAQILENLNQRYELAKNMASSNRKDIDAFVGNYEELVSKTSTFFEMSGGDIAAEYLQVLSGLYSDAFLSTPELTELELLLKNYDTTYFPVYYDTTSIIAKKPFVNFQVFALLTSILGFILSLVFISIRSTLNSKNN